MSEGRLHSSNIILKLVEWVAKKGQENVRDKILEIMIWCDMTAGRMRMLVKWNIILWHKENVRKKNVWCGRINFDIKICVYENYLLK